MAKQKKSIEQMVSEIVQNQLEAELHRQVRKARKVVAKQRKITKDQLGELKALPDPNVIEGEYQESIAVVNESAEQGRD